MSINYLTSEDVLALHDYAVERFGGSLGLADRGKLEASIAAPMQNVFGAELYSDLWSKAAIDVANSLLSKDDIAEWLKLHAVPGQHADR